MSARTHLDIGGEAKCHHPGDLTTDITKVTCLTCRAIRRPVQYTVDCTFPGCIKRTKHPSGKCHNHR